MESLLYKVCRYLLTFTQNLICFSKFTDVSQTHTTVAPHPKYASPATTMLTLEAMITDQVGKYLKVPLVYSIID